MKPSKALVADNLTRLNYFLYLVPIFGVFPALWRLYRQQGSREEQRLARLVIFMAFVWLAGTLLMQTSSQANEGMRLPLLLMSSVLTSGYFVTNLWLMIRVWQRKSPTLFWGDRKSKRR
ncbi:MAG: hypothetical protein NZ772_15575 [Cyanobacteria bacterium]|nr:hypothetical protein [Cyanobacteriota bacterium]MDW8202756.1 hypothetical protein [Cyanobacteriota bacterium SKYGB_h_bin112]